MNQLIDIEKKTIYPSHKHSKMSSQGKIMIFKCTNHIAYLVVIYYLFVWSGLVLRLLLFSTNSYHGLLFHSNQFHVEYHNDIYFWLFHAIYGIQFFVQHPPFSLFFFFLPLVFCLLFTPHMWCIVIYYKQMILITQPC